MSKIAIISTGYMWFPCEAGPGRMFSLAMAFKEAGYEVDVIVTDFQHFKKEPRDKELILSQGYPLNILFAHAPAYSKNISLARIKSNKEAAKNISGILKSNISEYRAVIVSVPPNDIAAEVTEICLANEVACIADVEDLWPEAMVMVLKNEFLRNMALGKFTRDAERAYAACSAVMGTSPDYTARAFKKKKRNIPSMTVHVGCDIETFDSGAKLHRDEFLKPVGEHWVTYAGSVAGSYDIRTLVDAAAMLLSEGKTDIKVHILGTGVNLEELSTYVKDKGITNVTFHGFIPYPVMAAFLTHSDCLVNSFIKTAPQSIVNKVGDYLAAGKPMINTLENPVFCKLVDENRVGINVESENATALKVAMETLCYDQEKARKMGQNARALCLAQFDRTEGNKRIIELVRSLTKEGR